jgi:hypothetical protein
MIWHLLDLVLHSLTLLALGVMLHLICALTRKVDDLMTQADDLKAAVADLQTSQMDGFIAIDKEISQLAAAVASGTLPPDQAASIQSSIDNIKAATQSMKDATARLASDRLGL